MNNLWITKDEIQLNQYDEINYNIKEKIFSSSDSDILDKYMCSGIWIMFGYKDGKYRCLEVAETDNIKKELTADIGFLNTDNKVDSGTMIKARIFRREFSDCFYKLRNEKRCIAKYRDIANKYDSIVIYISKLDDIESRYKMEVKLAMEYKAAYWYPCPNNPEKCKINQWQEINYE